MKVVLTEEAKAQVRRRRAWWRRTRDQKTLFTEAFQTAKASLVDAPKLTVHGIRDGLEVRRLSLGQVHCFVYYTISENDDVVTIISVWGQEREHQPDFVKTD